MRSTDSGRQARRFGRVGSAIAFSDSPLTMVQQTPTFLVAFRPPAGGLRDDRLFSGETYRHFGDASHWLEPTRFLAQLGRSHGMEFHTDDMVDLKDAAVFVFGEVPQPRRPFVIVYIAPPPPWAVGCPRDRLRARAVASPCRGRAREPDRVVCDYRHPGCRLPGEVYSPQDFWQLLLDKTDAITEIPADRWRWQSLLTRTPSPGAGFMSEKEASSLE